MHAAHQMHVEHRAEILDLHLGKTLVAQDARIGDQDIHPPPSSLSLGHHRANGVEIGDRSSIGDGLTTHANDLGRYRTGCVGLAAASVHRAAGIIDPPLSRRAWPMPARVRGPVRRRPR